MSTESVLSVLSHEKSQSSERATCRQVSVTLAAGLSCVAVGCCLGWPSPTLEQMTSPDWEWPGPEVPWLPWFADIQGAQGHSVPLTGDESSWVVSLMDLGVVLGSLPAGWAADTWGRRPVLLFCSLPFVLSWVLVLLARGPALLYVARLLQGLASAVAMIVTVMYAGEVSEDRLRGTNSTLVAVLMNLGLVMAYSIGPYVPYHWLAVSLLVVPVVFALVFPWCPESPPWLLRAGRLAEAELALQWLRDTDALGARNEANTIETAIVEEERESSAAPGYSCGEALRDLLVNPGPDRKAFFIVITLCSMQSLSGFNAMLAYSAVTLPGGLVLGPNEFVIFFGVISLLSTLAGAGLIDRVGRRPLLLVFAALQTVSLAGSALYYTLEHRTVVDLSAPGLAWLPAAALMIYGVAYPIGLGSVPNALQVELFSARVKGLALPAVLVAFNALTFLVSKTYEVVAREVGKDVAFWFFSADCLAAVLFTALVLKETKGKSFQQIQELLDSSRRPRVPTWPV